MILDLAGGSPHPPLLQALRRLQKVPGSLEEQVIVVVEGVHRVDVQVDLDDVRLGLEAHRQRAVRAETIALDWRRVHPRQLHNLRYRYHSYYVIFQDNVAVYSLFFLFHARLLKSQLRKTIEQQSARIPLTQQYALFSFFFITLN